MLDASTPQEIAEFRRVLGERVIGQSPALVPIVDAYAKWKAGLAGIDKPVAAFLILGPPGVGKTLTVEELAELLHGDRRLIKIHCAEHRAGHEISRLIGSPPGYVGHRETEPALSRRRVDEARSDKCRLAFVLLDEIEKAHPDFWNLFLGVLDKGELFLGNGERSDLRETMIFMTSNAGSRQQTHVIGFQGGAGDRSAIAEGASRRIFSPEFRNRLTATLVYRALSEEDLWKITELELKRFAVRLAERAAILITWTPAVTAAVLDSSQRAESLGAREIRRTAERLIELPISNLIISGAISKGSEVGCTAMKGEIKFLEHGRKI